MEGIEGQIALAAHLVEEEEREQEELMLFAARIAAEEMADLEEGVWLDEVLWVPVTVDINEYHNMGDPCFSSHFRMSRGVFEAVLVVVGGHLRQRGRLIRERTPLQDILLMVIWILATPDSFRSVALRFGKRPSTLHYFYSYIVEALRELAGEYISWPNQEARRQISDAFRAASGFPGIVGCIDCTHVYVTAPVQDAAQYRNRHHSYSLNVQAVVDKDLLVRDLRVGEVGSMGDARVFRRSPLYQSLIEDHPLDIEEHLIGDGAYTLTDFMMIPYENNGHLNEGQLNFNRRLSQCRVRVENAFGRAKGKWRRLKFLYARNQGYVIDHITASFVLHNFQILNGEEMFDEDELERPILDNEVLGAGNGNAEGLPEDEHPLLPAAHARGIEKRSFIAQHVLPAAGQN